MPPIPSPLAVPDPALSLAVGPDDAEVAKNRVLEAIAFTKPYLRATGGQAAGGGATTDTVGVPAGASPFEGIEILKVYPRPNGEQYIPRVMKVAGSDVQDVTMIRTSVRAKMPVLLYGPPGTGKTAMIEAAHSNVHTIQGTIETETADFVGSWVQNSDGTYSWVDGPLVVAAEKGEPLFIDEIALIDPRSLAVVYGAMDGRDEIVVTQNPRRGSVKVQPGFIVLGAFNPDVPGAIMSDALMSRFPVQIEVTTDWGVATKLGVPSKIIQVVRNLNTKATTGEVTAAPQLRELIAFKRLHDTFGEEFALRNFLSQIRPENRDAATKAITATFGTCPAPLSL